MDTLVKLSDFPKAEAKLKALFSATIDNSKLRYDYEIVENTHGLGLKALIEQNTVLTSPLLKEAFEATHPKPTFKLFRDLLSIFDLTKIELQRFFTVYSSWMEFKEQVRRPGLGIGIMNGRDGNSVERTATYKKCLTTQAAAKQLPEGIKNMLEERAELTHVGIVLLIELPKLLNPRVVNRALARTGEAALTYWSCSTTRCV